MANILIVDDDEALLEAMQDILSARGHRTRGAVSGASALAAIEVEQPELIVADVVMPGMTGLQLLEAVRQRPGWDSIPFMFVSAIDAPDIERQIAALGAETFLRKPFDDRLLSEAVESRLKRAEEVRLAESRRAYFSTIELLADIIEARDGYTREHTGRVRRYATALAERLGRSERHLEAVALIALLHDVGKIAVPDAILNKPGPLTEAEREIIRRHSSIGAEIVGRVPYLARASAGVRGHHERWDGGGYPDGLAGEAIPLEARIVALADAFDAITSDRAYRTARPVEAALDELRREAGHQFDPDLARLFEDIVRLGRW